MSHDANHQKCTKQIRSIVGNNHQPPDQKYKHHDYCNCTEKPQFLTDDGENHIILCFRYEAHFLHALSKSLAKNSAGTDCIQRLQGLKAFSACIGLRIQPGKYTCKTIIHTTGIACLGNCIYNQRRRRNSTAQNQNESSVAGRCHKQHQERNSHNDNG